MILDLVTKMSMYLLSDADSTFLPEGGQPHQLLNVGLKLASMFCSKV